MRERDNHYPVNLSASVRYLAGGMGAACIAAGIRRRSVGGTLLTIFGSSLIFHGMTGYSPLIQWLSRQRRAVMRPEVEETEASGALAVVPTEEARPFDVVEEASEESFPASDPPGWD